LLAVGTSPSLLSEKNAPLVVGTSPSLLSEKNAPLVVENVVKYKEFFMKYHAGQTFTTHPCGVFATLSVDGIEFGFQKLFPKTC